MRDQRHASAALYPRERPGAHCAGGWVGFSAGLGRCGKSRPHWDFFLFLCSDVHRSLQWDSTYILARVYCTLTYGLGHWHGVCGPFLCSRSYDVWVCAFVTLENLLAGVGVPSGRPRNSCVFTPLDCCVCCRHNAQCFYCVAIHNLSFFLIALCMYSYAVFKNLKAIPHSGEPTSFLVYFPFRPA